MKDLFDKFNDDGRRFSPENDGIDGILTDDYSDIDRGEHMDLFDHLEQDIELYG